MSEPDRNRLLVERVEAMTSSENSKFFAFQQQTREMQQQGPTQQKQGTTTEQQKQYTPIRWTIAATKAKLYTYDVDLTETKGL